LLPASKQKEYDLGMKNANVEFDRAFPYLKLSFDLNPKSENVLQNLKTYYMLKKNQVKVDEMTRIINNENPVEYKISCEKCDITYTNSSGGTEQVTNGTSSWTYSFNAKIGQNLSLSAQNKKETGTITVRIFLDGKEIKSSTSSGAYVIATTSAVVEK
jgi:hypothetical protein